MVGEGPEDAVGAVGLPGPRNLLVGEDLIDRRTPEVAVRDFAVLVQPKSNLPNIPGIRRGAVPGGDLVGQRRLAVDEVCARLVAGGGRVGFNFGRDLPVEVVVGEGDVVDSKVAPDYIRYLRSRNSCDASSLTRDSKSAIVFSFISWYAIQQELTGVIQMWDDMIKESYEQLRGRIRVTIFRFCVQARNLLKILLALHHVKNKPVFHL